MNHEQIDRLNLVGRYLMGKLLADERASFEEHFVACPQCTDQLRTTRDFLRDFRLLAAEQAAPVEARPRVSVFSEAARAFLPRPLVWGVAGLLVAVTLGLAFVINYSLRLRAEVAQTRGLAEQWQRRYDDERQSAVAADRQRQEAEARQAEQLRALEAELERRQAQRAGMAAPPARQLAPEGELLSFNLTSVRGYERGQPGAGTQVVLPNSAAIFALSIPLEEETRSETYRMTVLNDRKRPIRTIDKVKPGPQDALSVWLRSDSFRPGRYTLLVEGTDKEGARHVVGEYLFQIVKTP